MDSTGKGGSQFELMSMEEKGADKEEAQAGPGPSLPRCGLGLRIVRAPARRRVHTQQLERSRWGAHSGRPAACSRCDHRETLVAPWTSRGRRRLVIDSIPGPSLNLRNLLLCPPTLSLSPKQSHENVLTMAAEVLTKRYSGEQMNLCLLRVLPGPRTLSPNEREWLRSEHEASRCTFGGLGQSDQSEFHSKLWDQPRVANLCRTLNIRQERAWEMTI